MQTAEGAIRKAKEGKVTIIYDGDEREGEADMVLWARFAEPGMIQAMRKDAGGLICAAIDGTDAKLIGLPFFTDILEKSGPGVAAFACRKTAYGDKPAFSLPVNHKDVYTGITDKDRSLTLTKLDSLISGGRHAGFAGEFYSPGHIFLLIGSGIGKRRGHTELSLELAKRAGIHGAMVLCEMLGDDGKALPKAKAREYALRNGYAFIEGKELVGDG